LRGAARNLQLLGLIDRTIYARRRRSTAVGATAGPATWPGIPHRSPRRWRPV
jgi:hypothetical protein